ncbi:MAG: DUF4861 family protein [Bacteroidales bacterium]|nr:DUF4861 family protein [Bacteroidales bacterium]
MKKIIVVAVLVFLFLNDFAQNPNSVQSFTTIANDGAWCWFSDPRAVSFKGNSDRTYVGWISSQGDVTIAAYDNVTGITEQKIVKAGFEKDDHNNPSILIRPDGKILVFYSEHGGKMFLVTSRNPEDISSWEKEHELKEFGSNVCYSNPVQLTSENNRIYLFWRGSDWQPAFSYSDDAGFTWAEAKAYIKTPKSDGSQRPYVKVSSDGIKRIDFAFTDGHPRNEAENSIYHMYYENGNIYQTNGKPVCRINELPVSISHINKLYDGTISKVRAWIWDIATDEKSRPVIVYTQLPGETDHRYHYARWNGKKWLDVEITQAGKWFPETPENTVEREPHYSGGIVLDHTNPSVVYLSKPVNSVFEIEKWTTPDQGKKWNTQAFTQNSSTNNIRPFVVRNYSANGPKVLWMNVFDHYAHYTDFLTSIKCDLPVKAVLGNPADVLSIMRRVADWQLQNPRHETWDWTNGALYTGIMAVGRVANDEKYYKEMIKVGDNNHWKEGPRRYFADDYCVGQMYAELFNVYQRPYMIEGMKNLGDSIIARPHTESLEFVNDIVLREWAWCDALFMGPTTLSAIYKSTGEIKFLDIANKLWWKTTDYLYDKDEKLYYRDSRFFDRREANGKKVFWSRGNGWVFGGLARVISTMPENYPDRSRYLNLFNEMAEKLASIQCNDGTWHASLLDPDKFPAKETSGTAFYCYGLAWGINQGILDKGKYLPVVLKAWSALTESVHSNGKLGYVQQISDRPENPKYDDSEVYAVGAFLLAGEQLIKMAHVQTKGEIEIKNTLGIWRKDEVIELDWATLIQNDASLESVPLIVKNKLTGMQLPYQIVKDETGKPVKLLVQSSIAPGTTIYINIKKGTPEKFKTKTFGRFVPERKDDFAWENDKIAFRMYGPALQSTGEISSGIDVWLKRTSEVIIDKWYKSDDYHVDHGEGLDSYKVGPTLGAGGIAPFANGKLYYSKNWTTYKVLTTGNLQTVFELTYSPWLFNGKEISETKRITLNAGSQLNQMDVTYNAKDMDTIPVATGIIKRAEKGVVTMNEISGYISYWEPASKKDGITGIGLVVPGNTGMSVVENHIAAFSYALNKKSFRYYQGACWDKAGEIVNAQEWENHLNEFSMKLKNPLQISINQ